MQICRLTLLEIQHQPDKSGFTGYSPAISVDDIDPRIGIDIELLGFQALSRQLISPFSEIYRHFPSLRVFLHPNYSDVNVLSHIFYLFASTIFPTLSSFSIISTINSCSTVNTISSFWDNNHDPSNVFFRHRRIYCTCGSTPLCRPYPDTHPLFWDTLDDHSIYCPHRQSPQASRCTIPFH